MKGRAVGHTRSVIRKRIAHVIAADVLPRIVIYFTPKGETHDGLLPASSTHSS
jgi:hypothetical protein